VNAVIPLVAFYDIHGRKVAIRAETSRIFLRDAHVLPKLLRIEEYCTIILVKFGGLGRTSEILPLQEQNVIMYVCKDIP
jgi:hypothetical protein